MPPPATGNQQEHEYAVLRIYAGMRMTQHHTTYNTTPQTHAKQEYSHVAKELIPYNISLF
jgi:hypothetical protein